MIKWDYDVQGWNKETHKLGYPRPQGKLPMFDALTPKKQQSLLNSWNKIPNNHDNFVGTLNDEDN